jgi:hypothetical protein
MKIICFFLVLHLVLPLYAQQAEIKVHPRNLVQQQANAENLQSKIMAYGQWSPFSKEIAGGPWQQLPETIESAYLKAANEALSFDWPAIPATLYMEYARNGNRTNFQNVYFKRRTVLSDLVIAEMIEGKGRFMDQISNGIWAICEESSWCIPAHSDLLPLPNVQAPVVDLFAAETATTLSLTYYFMKEKLDAISPLISRRIEEELDKRILTPLMERDDFWWMGFGERKDVNNWNPWIISNWLTTVIIIEKDQKKRAAQIAKAAKSLDNFINIYPEDGGCDEGPGYWSHAGGALFYCLDVLHGASDGAINLYEEPLVKNIATYIYKAHIAADYFVNFADASAKSSPDPDVVFRYGKSINDQVMMGFASYLLQNKEFSKGSYTMARKLHAMFSYDEISKYPPRESLLADVWLPESQVVASRSKPMSREGLYFAAKGGHNQESHNHNDVGNFILYNNGHPVIVDIGVEEYTKKTFSADRYDIWTMQSQYHTLPTVNGVMQQNGRAFRASDVQYTGSKTKVSFSLELKDAFPDTAGISSWHRTLTFNKGKSLDVTENYSLNKLDGETFLSFMTPCHVEILKPGNIVLKDVANGFEVLFSYNPDQLKPEIEVHDINDPRLRQAWGDRLYRLKMNNEKPALKGQIRYSFKSK